MPRLSRILVLSATALSLIGSGCTAPLHIGWSPRERQLDEPAPKPLTGVKAEEPAKELVKRPGVVETDGSRAEQPRPESRPSQLPTGNRVEVEQALAQLDSMPSLSVEERAQLKQDLSRAKPEDVPALLAVVRLISQRNARPSSKPAEGVAQGSPVEPVAPAPLAPAPEAKPIAAAAGPASASPISQHPLPQILGPSAAAPPITILPPGAYPGAAAGTPAAAPQSPAGNTNSQPQIIVNPLVPQAAAPTMAAPPIAQAQFAQPAGAPATNPPGYFPFPNAPAAMPAMPMQPAPGTIAPASAVGPTESTPAMVRESPSAVHWTKSLREALQGLERELAAGKSSSDKNMSSDTERSRQAILVRLLRLAAGDEEGAVRRLEDLPAEEQEYWAHQLLALNIALDPDGPPVASRRAALALRELRLASARLSNQATLEVRNLAFCSEVIGYGNYQRFPNVEFEPEQEVLLYAEIDNLRSAESKAGFRTNFQASLQVLDSAGKVVHDHNYPAGEDHSASRRRDFFVPFRTYIPKLSPGEYTLQLTIEDLQGKKFGQNTISFRIKRS